MSEAPDIVVRPMASADAASFRSIRLEALETDPDAYGSTVATESAWPLSTFAERLDHGIILGAFVGERVVGMVGLRPEIGPKTAHKAFLWGVFVTPTLRSHGVGRRLMEAAIAAAPAPVEQLTLSVAVANAKARALYLSCGFRPYGVEPRALKTADGYIDEIMMIRVLGEAGDTSEGAVTE